MDVTVVIDDHGHAHSADSSKHVHQCADGCGSFWVCGQRDGCDRPWICPVCEDERRDHYFNLEFERIQAQQEKA